MVYKKVKKLIISVLLIIFISFLIISCDKNDCWVCSNGKCYKCNGKGFDNINICKVCKGTKICFNCKGTGNINRNNYNFTF